MIFVLMLSNVFALSENIVSEEQVEAVPIIRSKEDQSVKYQITDNVINPEIEKKNKENEERYAREEAARKFKEQLILIVVIAVLIGAVIYIIKPIDKEKLGNIASKITKKKINLKSYNTDILIIISFLEFHRLIHILKLLLLLNIYLFQYLVLLVLMVFLSYHLTFY